ncbi:hypothetical protein IGI41_002824 [Enterococcus sp. DIV0876]
MMELGGKLKSHRVSKGYSQTFVAEQLNVSRQSISKWENDRGYPDYDNLVLLSQLYEVSIGELLDENEKLKKQIEENKDEISKKRQKLRLIRHTLEKDESLMLIGLSALASFIFPVGIIVCIFVWIRNKKNNAYFKLIYLLTIISLGLNLYAGYGHLSNYMGWGEVTIEQIE